MREIKANNREEEKIKEDKQEKKETIRVHFNKRNEDNKHNNEMRINKNEKRREGKSIRH